MLRGRIRFGLGAEGSSGRTEAILTAGQVIHLPANLPHSAEAIDDTDLLDLFSPPSATTGVDQPRAH